MVKQKSLTNDNTTKVEFNNSVQTIDKSICDDVNDTVIANGMHLRHTMLTLNSFRFTTQLLRSLLMGFILLTSLNTKQLGNFSTTIKFEESYPIAKIQKCTYVCMIVCIRLVPHNCDHNLNAFCLHWHEILIYIHMVHTYKCTSSVSLLILLFLYSFGIFLFASLCLICCYFYAIWFRSSLCSLNTYCGYQIVQVIYFLFS